MPKKSIPNLIVQEEDYEPPPVRSVFFNRMCRMVPGYLPSCGTNQGTNLGNIVYNSPGSYLGVFHFKDNAYDF